MGRRSLSLAPIVRRWGGELLEGGRRALVPGPGHSRADRSLSLLLADGRVIVHSFAGDDWRTAQAALYQDGLVDASGRLTGSGSAPPPAAPSRPERMACALTLWEAARPLAGTLAAAHLRRRGVLRDGGRALRFHPYVPAAIYAGAGPRRPALIAGIRGPEGRLCGVEVTYLAADGAAAAVAVPRKTVGLRSPGAAVRLDAVARGTLLVGEGVFSCLSASEALGLPAWALLSAGGFGAWAPPANVRRVIVAADRGRVGEAAAAALAARLRQTGVTSAIRLPPPGLGDWNDAARAGGGGRAGEGRTGSGGLASGGSGSVSR